MLQEFEVDYKIIKDVALNGMILIWMISLPPYVQGEIIQPSMQISAGKA